MERQTIEIQVNHQMFPYDMFHMVKAYFPEAEISQSLDEESGACVRILLYGEEFAVPESEVQTLTVRSERKRYVAHKVYDWLKELTGRELPWGIMTGVRPTKPMLELLEKGRTEEQITEYMKETYRVSDEKIKLGISVAEKERQLLAELDYKDGYSLYVGIPFCPSICSYCSFSSSPIGEWRERVDQYLDALCKEIAYVGEISKEKKLNTVYMGGGTPTTLEPEQLDRVLTCIEEHFSFEYLKEFTVEAGRPDSITKEKLEVLKKHNISRISINPQTMQQKTLDLIGRKHTVEDVKRVFALARDLGFDNINMDLIAGLPGETAEDMADTLRQIEELAPDSLTVHAFAMKRASKMSQSKIESAEQARANRKQATGTEERSRINAEAGGQEIARILTDEINMAAKSAEGMGLSPYYLYRQKNIAGNFENVGYAKVDKAGIYNILIMEEKQSIVAVGAGASTKVVLPEGQAKADSSTGNLMRILRIENVKDVSQYIDRIDEMIERKGELLWH